MKRFLLLLFSISIIHSLWGQQNGNMELIGRWGNGPCKTVTLYGNDYLFMGNGAYLEIVYLSNGDLERTEKVLLPGIVKDVAVTLTYAYVACGRAGIQIIQFDVGFQNPVVIGSFDTDGSAEGIYYTSGDYAYVADGTDGLVILDVTNKNAPSEAGYFTTSGPAWDVWVKIDTAYVAADTSGFWTVNVTNRSGPVLLDTIHTSGEVKGIYLKGNLAYLADGSNGVTVIDVTRASNLNIDNIWTAPFLADITDIYVRTSTAYLTDALYGVRLVDFLGAPFEIADLETMGDAQGISLDAVDNAFVADGKGGMLKLDVSRIPPSKFDSLATGDKAKDVLIDGDIVYVAGGYSGLWILDRLTMTADTTETLVRVDTLVSCYGLALKDTLLFVADNFNGLKILDVSEPLFPDYIKHVNVSDTAFDVDVFGDYAVVADGVAGVHVFDVSSPANPVDYWEFAFGTGVIARGVTVDSKRKLAYVSTDKNGVHIMNVEGKVDLGPCPGTSDAFGVDISAGGDTIFVADGANGILVFDVSDSTSPVFLDTLYNTDGIASDIFVKGKTAIVADGEGTVRMIDFWVTPQEIDVFHTAGTSQSIDLVNDTLAVADGEAGVYFLEIDLAGYLVALVDSLEFANVIVGKSRILHVGLTNTGTSPLQVTDITSNGQFMCVDRPSISPGDTNGIDITFSPLIQDVISDTLVIESNAANSQLKIPVRGTGIEATQLTPYAPDYYTYALYHMESLVNDTVVVDSSTYGFLDGYASGTNIASGRFGSALQFQDADYVFVLPDSFLLLPEFHGFSVDTWFKLTQQPGGRGILFRMTQGSRIIFELAVDDAMQGNQGLVASMMPTTSDTVDLASSSNFDLNLNQWYHGALTYDKVFKLYLNGVLVDSAITDMTKFTSPIIMSIGNTITGSNTVPGLIDEFRMSGVAREPWEFNVSMGSIAVSYDSLNLGNVLVSKNRTADLIVINVGPGMLWVDSLQTEDSQFEVYPSSFELASGKVELVRVTFSPTATGLVNDTLKIYSQDILSPVKTVRLYGTGDATQATGPYTVDSFTSVLWHMDGQPGDTAIINAGLIDIKGFLLGEGFSWDTTAYRYGSSSLYFNGQTGWIWIPWDTSWSSTSEDWSIFPFTLDYWFNIAEKPDTGDYYVITRQGLGDSTRLEILYGDSAVANQGLIARIYSLDNTAYTLQIPDSIIYTEKWYHTAYLWDGNWLRLYLNGLLIDSTGFSGLFRVPSSSGSAFGSHHGLRHGFKGHLDEVRSSGIARQPWEFNGVGPSLYTTRGLFSFGEVLVGDTSVQTVTIVNNGYQTLMVSDINWTNSVFSVSDTSFQIPSGESLIDTVTFIPAALGIVQDTLIVVSNDLNQDTLQVPMVGTGITGPNISTVTQISFDSVLPGESSVYSLTISNNGDESLVISDINWTNSVFTVSDTSDTIGVGDSDIIVLTFTPVTIGDVQDSLVIISNDPSQDSLKIPMTGTGAGYRSKQPYSVDTYTVALYHFDRTSDSVVEDATDNNHDGTLVNGVARLDTGYFGGALHLDGIDDYVLIPSSDDLVFDMSSESFTIECFFRTDTVSHALFFKDLFGGNNKANYGVSIDKNGKFALYGFDNGTTRVTDGAWHHVAFIYDAETGMGSLYLDGSLELQQDWISGQTDTETKSALILGAREFSTSHFMSHFEGDFDEVRISNIARNPWEFVFFPTGIEISSESVPVVGTDYSVNITVPNEETAKNVTLYYRQGGQSAYKSVAADSVDSVTYLATIPGQDVTFKGLEFYVKKKTESDSTTYPLYDPINKPLTGSVRFSSVTSEITLAAKKYAMISVPADLNKPRVYDVLHDDMGEYSPLYWRFFTWKDTGYVEFSDSLSASDSLYFNFTRGKSFWIIPAETKTFDVGSGYTASTDSAFQFNLKPQWNMIGSPFPFPVTWDDCILSSDSIGTLYYYDGTGYRLDWPSMEPWRGYWIYNAELEYTVFSIPPRQATILTTGSIAKGGVMHKLQKEEWLWKISAETEEAKDLDNYVGVRRDAQEGWDLRDRFEPPPIGDYVALYFDHSEWENYSGIYAADIRGPGRTGYIWEFVVETRLSEQSIGMFWNLIQTLPKGWVSYLVDEDEGMSVNLKEREGYEFISEKQVPNVRRFRLLVGSPEFVENQSDVPLHPVRFHLFQNYPNPFNPETTIEYTIPKNGNVLLTIFNMLGQRIRVLVNEKQKTGEHWVSWDGLTDDGMRASSGIYFCKLKFLDQVTIRKLVLVR